MTKNSYLIKVLLFVIGFILIIGQSDVVAQSGSQWETPQWIPGLVDTSPARFPIFLADQNGVVHVFHSQWVNDIYTIVYSQWLVGVGWTKPVDILIPPREQARVTSAFLDDENIVHLVFWSGDQFYANIYYAYAPLESIDVSTAWSEPVIIGPGALDPLVAILTGDGQDTLLAVFGGNVSGNGLYAVSSQDGGLTWTTPEVIFRTYSETLWPYGLQLRLTSDGIVHAVWSSNSIAGLGTAVYYANADIKQLKWSDPFLLAEAIGYEAATPNVIKYNDDLIVVYHNNFPSTRWMRRSTDGGKTWTSPTRLFEQVGSNGAAALIIDKNNTLHMFFGNRVGNPAIHGLWHSTWLGNRWSNPQALISGPQILVGPNGEEGFDPSYAQAFIISDNIIFVAWRHDPMAGPTHIWYSYQRLNISQPTPDNEIIKIPSPTPQKKPLIEPTPTTQLVVVSNTTIPDIGDEEINKGVNPILNILMGIIPVIIIIVAIFYIQRRKY